MRTTIVFLLAILLAGCMYGANKKGISATFMFEGAIVIHKVDATDHNFEVHMYENEVGAMDLYGINTITSDGRAWVAADALSFSPTLKQKDMPICLSSVTVIREHSYFVENHPKRWLNTKWWKLDVYCGEVNPHYKQI